MGAAYGTAKSGVGIAAMGVFRPELVMKSIVPVVMAGVLGIYGLIIAVIISTNTSPGGTYTLFQGYAHLGSGLSCGLSGLAAGMAIGIVGDAGVRANAQQPKLFTGMILILIFAEALALYGLIVGIILSSAGSAVSARGREGVWGGGIGRYRVATRRAFSNDFRRTNSTSTNFVWSRRAYEATRSLMVHSSRIKFRRRRRRRLLGTSYSYNIFSEEKEKE